MLVQLVVRLDDAVASANLLLGRHLDDEGLVVQVEHVVFLDFRIEVEGELVAAHGPAAY